MGAADVDGVIVGVCDVSIGSAKDVDEMRLFLDGVVSGTLSTKDGSSLYSVTVEREEGTLGFFADLILPVVCGRTGLCSGARLLSGCSITLTFGAGEPAAASSARRLRRPGVHPVKPSTILRQGDCVTALAGALSGAARLVAFGSDNRGVCGGSSRGGDAMTATTEVDEVAAVSRPSVRVAAGGGETTATAVVFGMEAAPRLSAWLVLAFS